MLSNPKLFTDISAMQFDFFSAVLFLVAGPTVGYTLRKIQMIVFKMILRETKINVSSFEVTKRGIYSPDYFKLI